MEFNFEKICRVCLNEDEKMMSLFKVNVSRKMMACASVQVWPNDELPTQICHKCCAKLHIAFQFKKQCEKSDSKLRTYLVKYKKVKNKDKQKPPNELYEEQGVMKNMSESGTKSQELIQQENAVLQTQNSCLYVECTGELMNVHVQDPSFIQNGQSMHQPPLGHLNNFNVPQQTLQIGNCNIQNVIYGTTYPLAIQQPLQATNLVHNQIVSSLPMHQPPVHHSQPCIQEPTIHVSANKSNDAINTQAENTTKTVEKNRENSNQCPVCLKIFQNATKKNRHVKIHSRTDMPYKCTVCNKEFMHGGNYKIHMRIHNNERPFCCSVCPKRFIQAQDLEKHMRTHTGERPHKCPMCWKAFSTGSNLIAHIRTHTGERPYACSVCTKAFCQSNELTKHMRTHTGEKSHKCDICNKGFNGSSTLIVHKRSHTGEKPFICKVCDKSFTQSSCLTAHLKRYGDSKYSCDLCNVAYHSEKILQEHSKIHEHNENLLIGNTYGKSIASTQSDFDEHISAVSIDGS